MIMIGRLVLNTKNTKDHKGLPANGYWEREITNNTNGNSGGRWGIVWVDDLWFIIIAFTSIYYNRTLGINHRFHRKGRERRIKGMVTAKGRE